jgi:hypothetical protein
MKTEQQKRFEAVWSLPWPQPFHEYWFRTFDNGEYEDDDVQDAFKAFQLGEASGLAMAAAECEKKVEDWGDPYDASDSRCARACAEAIRALMTEGVKP